MNFKTKFILALFTVLIMFGAVIGVYYSAIDKSIEGFKAVIDKDIKIELLADEVLSNMLQCRRNEKDFILRKKEKYLGKLSTNVENIKKASAEIETIAKESNYTEIAEKANKIIVNAETYKQKFTEIVNANKVKGLTHSTGLQGEFRKIAHSIANDMPEHDIGPTYLNLLLIRRYEKDYMRKKSDKYKGKLKKAITNYKNSLLNSACEPASQKIQLESIMKYQKAFEIIFSGNSTEADYDIIRKEAHIMEDAVMDIYVPNAGKTLLDIRKNEKDYLLRGSEKYVQKTLLAVDKLKVAFTKGKVLKVHIDAAHSDIDKYKNIFIKLVDEDKEIKVLTYLL